MSSLYLLLPELTLAVVAIFILLMGAFFSAGKSSTLLTVTAALTLLFAFMMMGAYYPTSSSSFMGMVRVDALTVFMKMAVVVAALASLILAHHWGRALEHGGAEYPVLMLFATIGLMLMVSADNFLAFYVALELASLTMYVMASYERDNLKSTEAGLKYFVLGSLASGMMLFGISLIYGFSGTIGFEGISQIVSGQELPSFGIITGLVLVLVAVCFKVSAVPFHMWTPDVYEGAPTPVVAFFATAPKLAVLCFLLRLTSDVFGDVAHSWQQVLLVVSLGSMLVGAFAGLVQQNLKRLIAYSSIGHIGYVLMGVLSGNVDAAQAVLVYMVIYMTMSLGLFACLVLLRRDGREVQTIGELAGLSTSHPKIAAALSILTFSMAGIPPFAGFFAKMFIFTAALQAGYAWLVVVAALSSVVACFYYIRIVKVMYFDKQTAAPTKIQRHSATAYLLLASIAVNLFVVHPSILIAPAKVAARALFP
jgi:NADH-quinone oxidoreductase subunit N